MVYINPSSLAGGGIAEKAAAIFRLYDTGIAVNNAFQLTKTVFEQQHNVVESSLAGIHAKAVFGLLWSCFPPLFKGLSDATLPTLMIYTDGKGELDHEAMMSALAELGVLNGLTVKKLSKYKGSRANSM